MAQKGQNKGQFRAGPDPRRHVLTREERQRGGRAAFILLATNRPELVRWVQRKMKSECFTRTKARNRRRRRLYAAGKLDGAGY